MVDFACKEFEIEAVIKCGLNLTKAELQILKYFLQYGQDWLTTETIAEELDLNLSTVQRSVKKLYERKILIRSQNNMDGGGYFFVYKIRSKKDIHELIMDTVNNWVKRVDSELRSWADENQ
ncbi:HTH domain-containing protein [Methanolobus psychrotolerans]|uniref:HTH domain-containing protein n=1 Tax=Methanolobus psychrotolerans TaxID=1874706 RepID=UPI000B91544F|nr:HTH domain-containing protein [Methanolobus psychrotolerans]